MEDELERMRPGIVDGLGEIFVTEKESTIPHFTLIKNDGSEVKIMMLENKYMPDEHNNLTSEECSKLNVWMHSNEKKEWWNGGWPNWDHMITAWNGLYNDYEIECGPDYLDMIPDYTTIHH